MLARHSRSAAAAALFCIVLLSSSNSYAQSGTGEVWGRVATMAGDAIRDAAVTATNIDTGAVRRTKTGADGRFAFPLLPAGRYQVTALHDGFAGRRQDDIVLLPGARMAIALQLRLALLPETIALNPYPPILEATRSHASAFVAETELHDLPVIGLRYLRLAQLTPAVSMDPNSGGIAVMDLPSTANRLVVDGFDHTSSLTGEPIGREGPGRVPYQFGLMSIGAYRVNTSAPPAEIGHAAGAAIDVVTKSGTNELHGTGYEFFGDRALNGETFLDARAGAERPAYRSNQFGAVVGGPLATDRHFFLVSADALRRTAAPAMTFASEPFTPVGAAALTSVQRAFERVARDDDQDLLLARTDHVFGSQHATLRYVDQRFTGTPVDATRLQPSITSTGLAGVRTRSGAGALASALGGHVVNEARGQYASIHDAETAQSSPAGVILQGGSFVGQTGTSLFGPHAFATRRAEFADDLSLVGGGHSITVGGNALRDQHHAQFFGSTTFGYQNIPAFAAGTPNWIVRTSDSPNVPLDVVRLSGYAQDAWRASESVTFDLGARYDVEQFSTPMSAVALPAPARNWAPRAGIAIAPGAHASVFRAAYAVMYGTTPALVPAMAIATFGGRSMVAIDRGAFQAPRVQQASAGWELEKYRIGTLGIGYLFARGEHLARPIEGDLTGRFPIGRTVTYASSGNSLYNGVTLNVRARVLQQLFYTIAYTFSRSDETPLEPLVPVFGAWNERFVLPRAGWIDKRAPGSADQHHNLSISALYDTALLVTDMHGGSRRLLEDWNIGLVYTLQSGQPYSAIVNGDLNGDGNPFNDLAPGTTWNQYRLPWQARVDPRVSRSFPLGGARRLSVIWEAFNVTNRPSFTSVDTIRTSLSGSTLVPNPLFQRKTGEAAGRVMQLAGRISW